MSFYAMKNGTNYILPLLLPDALDVKKKQEHSLDTCANPEKLDKFSRAIESMGSVKTVLDIWKDCPNAYVAAIITDKDSTTCSKLSHSELGMVAAERMQRKKDAKHDGR